MVSLKKSFTVFRRLLSKRLGVNNKGKLEKYLGCPMDVDGRSLKDFQSKPAKVEKTITSWKFMNLTQAGKLILINSILIAYASHIMAMYQIPKYILNQTPSHLLKFWWASSHDRKPIYWRKRKLLEKSKNSGGALG